MPLMRGGGSLWVHTYGHGAAGSPAHWTSPNNISFTDNAWILAWSPSVSIKFYNKDKVLVYGGTMDEDSCYVFFEVGDKDTEFVTPPNAEYVQVSCQNFKSPLLGVGEGAIAFDGCLYQHNTHMKMKYSNGTTYDSGYFKVKS